MSRGVARSRVNRAYLRGDAGVGWVMLLSSAALRAHLQAQMSARPLEWKSSPPAAVCSLVHRQRVRNSLESKSSERMLIHDAH
jgi:hypothetical protein